MSTLPCPRCGSDQTLGTFCKDCLRELHPLVQKIKPAKLVLCANCDNAHLLNIWKSLPQEDAVRKALSPSLVFDNESDVTSVEFGEAKIERKPGIKKTTNVLAVVTGHHKDANTDYEEEYDIPLYYEVISCPRCRKKGTAYFEGILQIRNQSDAIRNSILEYIRDHKDKGLRLAKEVPVSSGSDYYISSQRAVNHLSKQLHAKYGGELKVSAQHFSANAQSGKILYRVNALLEIPEYSKGDVIERNENYFYVLGVGVKVKAENLKTGQNESFAYEIGAARRLPVKTTQVSNIDPVEVLHPTTFQSVVPTNSKYAPAELAMDDEVSVAVDGNYLFLIPRTEDKGEAKKSKKRHSQKRRTRDDDLVNKN